MLRALLLLGLVFASLARAAEPPGLELTATPAWKGWTRPGRTTELDLRLSAGSATRAQLDVSAGRLAVHSEVDLEPGRVVRLHVPVPWSESLVVSAATPAAGALRREVTLSPSESPLLGVAVAGEEGTRRAGFHVVALGADDLPRSVAAYASIDALIVDAPTLAALDPAQLGALLAHAAGCGRVVVLNADERVRRLLSGAGSCDGLALMNAASMAEAQQRLDASLAAGLRAPMRQASTGELTRATPWLWQRVALGLAVYGAAALLALVSPSWLQLRLQLLLPAAAGVLAWALLQWAPPASQLLIWSEGVSGAQLARYQAWQQVLGLSRQTVRVPIPPQLASSAQPCDPRQPVRFEFDARQGRASFAEFDSGLFRQVALCYSGSFPVARAPVSAALSDGVRQVHNAGFIAWPAGRLLAAGQVHELPALGADGSAALDMRRGQPPGDAATRVAMSRLRPDEVGALWALELAGVADSPRDSRGWLLVSVPAP